MCCTAALLIQSSPAVSPVLGQIAASPPDEAVVLHVGTGVGQACTQDQAALQPHSALLREAPALGPSGSLPTHAH